MSEILTRKDNGLKQQVIVMDESISFDQSVLASEEYLRGRLSPKRGDGLYLHLADLLTYMRSVKVPEGSKILDFGAGGSPYLDLFPGCIYRRADISTANQPDYLISDSGIVEERDKVFDVILSTQVAEHVREYREYLNECFRLLKPNGKLILTIPGMYEEHGCPNDFQRWMVQGIKRDVEKAGFVVSKVTKLTVGPRAILFFFDRCLDTMQMSRKTVAGILHFSARCALFPFRGIIHALVDRFYGNFRIWDGNDENQPFYLGLAVEAYKPE